MDKTDKLLEQLAQAVPPPISNDDLTVETFTRQRNRRLALHQLIQVIQESNKLFLADRYNFPPYVYQESLQETYIYICRNIHNYDPQKGKVITLINFVLDKKFKEAKARYLQQQQTISLDTPISSGNDEHQDKTILLETIPSSTTDKESEYTQLRECLEEDKQSIFQKAHIRNKPQANFRAIALKRLDRESWQDMSEEWDIPLQTLARFYQRCLTKFNSQLKECLDN